MAADVTPGVTPGVTVRLVPMTSAQYEGWVADAISHYAAERAAAGSDPPAEAGEVAARQFAELLPQGRETPDHELYCLYDADERVGMLWLNVRHRSDGDHVFGYDFEIRADLRRRGYGRAALVACERICRERGVVALELNVFGPNLGARALYEEMGFEPTAIQMRKLLAAAAPGRAV